MEPNDFQPAEPGGPAQRAVAQQVLGPLEDALRNLDGDALEVEEEVEYEDDRVRTDVESAVSMPTSINLFQHPDAHPFVLDLALLRKYGPEWMQWEPEVLEARIIQDFHTKNVSQLNFDKLQAVKCLHLVDLFWDSWVVFVPCVQALSNVPPDFRVLSSVTVPQLLIAVDIASKLRADVEFNIEVKKYMEVCHVHDGMLCPIAPLDEILDVDGELYGIDCASVKKRWDDVRASRVVPTAGDAVENEQLRRMLEAHDLLEESRQQLNEQLPLLYND